MFVPNASKSFCSTTDWVKCPHIVQKKNLRRNQCVRLEPEETQYFPQRVKTGLLFLDIWIVIGDGDNLHKPGIGDISQGSQEGVLVEWQCLRSNCYIDPVSLRPISVDTNVHYPKTKHRHYFRSIEQIIAINFALLSS